MCVTVVVVSAAISSMLSITPRPDAHSSLMLVMPRLKRVSPNDRLASGLKVEYALAEAVADSMELVRPSYTNMSFSYASRPPSTATL